MFYLSTLFSLLLDFVVSILLSGMTQNIYSPELLSHRKQHIAKKNSREWMQCNGNKITEGNIFLKIELLFPIENHFRFISFINLSKVTRNAEHVFFFIDKERFDWMSLNNVAKKWIITPKRVILTRIYLSVSQQLTVRIAQRQLIQLNGNRNNSLHRKRIT